MKSNNNFLWLIAGIVLMMLLAFGRSERTFEAMASGSPIYEATLTNGTLGTTGTDTLVNAENDTLTIPENLISNWRYNYVLTSTQISGTKSVIMILQESSVRTDGTNGTWYELERDTATGASTTVHRLHGSANPDGIGWVKGVRQRVILDGGGTEVVTYQLRAIFKKD